jgi:hypothetical protein
MRNSKFLVLYYHEYYSVDGSPFNELADMHRMHDRGNSSGQTLRASSRKLSHTDAIQTIKHLPPLIVELD